MARSSKRSTTSSSTTPVVIKNVASFSAVPLCLSSPRLYAASLPVPDPAVPAK